MQRVVFACWLMAVLPHADVAAIRAEPPSPTPVKEEFVNVLGGKYHLPGPDRCKATVLVFIGHDCPISNTYSREIVRLCKEYRPKKVAFCVVYADADISKADARKHAKDYGFDCPAILDPKMTLARAYGERSSPKPWSFPRRASDSTWAESTTSMWTSARSDPSRRGETCARLWRPFWQARRCRWRERRRSVVTSSYPRGRNSRVGRALSGPGPTRSP